MPVQLGRCQGTRTMDPECQIRAERHPMILFPSITLTSTKLAWDDSYIYFKDGHVNTGGIESIHNLKSQIRHKGIIGLRSVDPVSKLAFCP